MLDHANSFKTSPAHVAAGHGPVTRMLALLRSPRVANGLKLGSFAVIVASLLATAALLPRERVAQLLMDWLAAAGIWGPVAFILLYILFTVLMLPGSILTILAGALFGLLWGTVAVSIGSTLGVAAAFLIARYLARDAVARKVQSFPRFAAIDRAVAGGGWKIVALLRLSPAVPFNLQNYLYGLTAIGFWPAVLASWAAMLPGTFLYVYLGRAVGLALLQPRELTPVEWAFFGVGLALTVVVTVYVTRLARRAIQQQERTAQEIAKVEAQSNEQAEAPQQANLLGTLVLVGLAGVMLVGTACAYLNADRIRDVFGPPTGDAALEQDRRLWIEHLPYDGSLHDQENLP
ncbi:MAG: TVP38/TMEM64 family protein [Phycisphaeraceae bacterium]